MMTCCIDTCCGSGSYCCEHANPHLHEACSTCSDSGLVISAYNHDQTVFVPCPDCAYGRKMKIGVFT